MNRKELERYELIRNIASRDWLSASSVSLTKLDQVKTSVYNLGNTVTDTKSLKPRARSAQVYRRKKSYTEIDTEPPLSRLSYQKTAWGSNSSIPELIRQQGERLHRPESASSRRRPWSGRKVPLSPSSQSGRQTAVDEQGSLMENRGPLILVKGERYDPRSRPPSGAVQYGAPDGEVAIPNTHEDLDQLSKEQIENTLEEFVNSQPNANVHNLAKLSAAYAKEDAVSAPPPPPNASPDIERMINGGGETSDENPTETKYEQADQDDLKLNLDEMDRKEKSETEAKHSYKEINVKQSPRTLLLRRPTPEPVTFSIPTGKDNSNSDEDDLDTERLLNGATTTNDVDIESSPVHDPDKYTDVALSSRFRDGAPKSHVTKATVTIAEDRNITVAITPRSPKSPKSPRRRNRMIRHRPRSAMSSDTTMSGSAGDASTSSYTRTSHPIVRRRPVSAKASFATSTVCVDYGEPDKKEDDVLQKPDGDAQDDPSVTEQPRKVKKKKDIETMMSQISILENEDENVDGGGGGGDSDFDEVENVGKTTLFGYQKSTHGSATKNYYEIAMEKQPHLKSSGGESAAVSTQKFKTIKTIEFGDMEPKETKTLAAIGQAPEGTKYKSDHEESEDEQTHKIHSSVRRPQSAKAKVITRPPPRPGSRMEQRPDLQKPTVDETDEREQTDDLSLGIDDQNTSTVPRSLKLKVRPFSAPHRRVHDGSRKSPRPHSPRKIKTRPRSASNTATVANEKCSRANRPQSAKAVMTPNKISFSEHKRNKEAVKALKDGSLYKGKPPPEVVREPESMMVKPYLGKQKDEKVKKKKKWVYETNDAMIMDDADEFEMQNLHEALLEKGVNVSVHTLKKGLMPPREKGYTECVSQLPSSSATSLLNHPEEWLGEVFTKYKLAEKALEKANERMIEQEELEAKMLAAAMQARTRKKKKVVKKRRHKRASTQVKSSGTASNTDIDNQDISLI
ncbi:uncharacterized protein LOC144441435 [Glandiceps talaboti]